MDPFREESGRAGKEAACDPAGAAGFTGEPGWRACGDDASTSDGSQRSDHGADWRWQVTPLFGARQRLRHAPTSDGRRDVPGLRVRDRRCILHLNERFHCDVCPRLPPVLVVRESRAVIRKETAGKVEQRRQAGRQASQVWLAADYHFPSTYSCRIPMSSMSSAPVMPAPGPATVRLALIRTGIECFGLDAVRDELFPILRSAPVRVRPPERVAISHHARHGYRWSSDKAKRRTAQESIIVREMAHAGGPMTIFLQVPEDFEQRLRVVLQTIGYWGQSSSLASCLGVTNTSPVPVHTSLPPS